MVMRVKFSSFDTAWTWCLKIFCHKLFQKCHILYLCLNNILYNKQKIIAFN